MKNSGPVRSASPAQRALMRAGLLVTVVGAALGAGGTTAMAADSSAAQGGADAAQGLADGVTASLEGLGGTEHAVAGLTGTLKNHQLDPLAGTGADPLDNGIATQVADFRQVGTDTLTGPITRGDTLGELPVVGKLLGPLPG
ncbi:hypothetical protein [Streptomyces sp. NPDC048172]|uniref:hypothetical protein n=1 Tax=Streptomyces sp. NPDC048172 TaxID=3365505 RepID=UPI00371B0165